MTDATPISIAYGDGVGPEVMNATLLLLRLAYANISIEVVEAGEAAYNHGAEKGMFDRDLESLRKQLNIPADKVYLHSDIAPVSDPGRLFPVGLYGLPAGQSGR